MIFIKKNPQIYSIIFNSKLYLKFVNIKFFLIIY